MEELRSVIAKNISSLRQASGMTQAELAQKLNLIMNKACSPSYKDRYSSSLEFIQALLKAKAEPKKLLDFF